MTQLFNQLIEISKTKQPEIMLALCDSNLPIHLYWKDIQGKLLGCNEAQAQNLGFKTSKDILGCTDFDLIKHADAEKIKNNDQQIINSNLPQTFIEGYIFSNQQWEVFSCKTQLKTEQGKVCGILGLSIISGQNILKKKSISKLTNRQMDCLYYLVKGMTMKQIAHQLNLSSKTVENYIAIIKRKLNCFNRTQLIEHALNLTNIRERL